MMLFSAAKRRPAPADGYATNGSSVTTAVASPAAS
jgi:hypothetical protein